MGVPAPQWLAAWQRSPAPWLATWCETTAGWLPTSLRACRPCADVPLAPAAPLRVHADETSLRQLAAHLRDDEGFARQPLWQGRCAETGSWTRLHDGTALPCSAPWLRLGARIAELARLSLPDEAAHSGAGWLASGALNIGPGEGLAWVEMARGLLLHHVQLDDVQANPRVAAYRVLAPTEWNFHPHGAVAAALETLPIDDTRQVQRRIGALMAAYDPCVRFDVELQPCQPETDYA